MVVRAEVGVLARVRAAVRGLGPSERRVADVIVQRPTEVIEWSTAELAEAAGASAATVIRACQSMGYRGFQHLRLELARSAPLLGRVDAAGDGGSIFADAVDAVRLTQETVDLARVREVADAMRRARRIVLVGNGFSGPPLQDFAMRLSTLGRSVEAPVDPLAQQFAAHSLGEGDLAFVLSYSGANVQSLRAAAAAVEGGAGLAVVTSYARSPIGKLAALVISTGPAASEHDVDPFLARLGHTVVLHALHSLLAQGMSDGAVASMRHVVVDALSED